MLNSKKILLDAIAKIQLSTKSGKSIELPSPQIFEEHKSILHKDFEKTLPKTKEGKRYLPIETYKEIDLSQEDTVNSPFLFLSSGTTKSERAKSYFSKEGLNLYKISAIVHFHNFLKKIFWEEELTFSLPGVSLIPKTEDWPQSSLAQMIAWFEEYWPIHYFDSEKHETFPTHNSNTPQWVYGTAFHYVNLFDKGFSHNLPSGSIIIETGGTKGKSRSVSQKELRAMISKMFGVPKDLIFSEYSMCEMASQAYSIFPLYEDSPRLSFPPWTKTYVMEKNGIVKTEGQGALCLVDPLRIDYPYLLRTQDIVNLKDDGSFEIKGRVPTAILKGCSLNVASIKKTSDSPKEFLPGKEATPSLEKREGWEEKLKSLEKLKDQFFASSHILELLTKEIGSPNGAQQAINDLLLSIPRGSKKWEKIVQKSQLKTGDKWLIFLPKSHPFVLYYPLFLCYLKEVPLTIRLPKEYEGQSSITEVLSYFKNQLGYKVGILPSSFRLPCDFSSLEISKILAYGSEETCHFLKNNTPTPVHIFGQSFTFSIINEFSNEVAKNLAKDTLSLGQQGCFSSRLTICLTQDKPIPDDFLSQVHKEAEIFWDQDFSIFSRVALDHESLRYKKMGAVVNEQEPNSKFLIAVVENSKLKGSIYDYLASHPFIFPIIICSQMKEVKNLLQPTMKYLDQVTTTGNLTIKKGWFTTGLKNKQLGTSNIEIWDGTHQGRPLFKEV